MIQSIPVLQAQEASEGVSASQEPPSLYQGPAAGMWGRPGTAPSSRVKSITAPTGTRQMVESTSTALGPGEAREYHSQKK